MAFSFRPMQHGQASVTALGAAGHRAAHQVLERGLRLRRPAGAPDPRARRRGRHRARQRSGRSGEACACSSRCAAASPRTRRAVRSKRACGRSWCWAQGSTPSPIDLSRPTISGCSSSIIRRRKPRSDAGLAEAHIAEPAHVSYVAHDFESGSMTAALKAAGLDTDRGAFVLWLGVTPYLTEEAVFATLGELAELAGRNGNRVRLYQSTRGGRRAQRAQLPSRDG